MHWKEPPFILSDIENINREREKKGPETEYGNFQKWFVMFVPKQDLKKKFQRFRKNVNNMLFVI